MFYYDWKFLQQAWKLKVEAQGGSFSSTRLLVQRFLVKILHFLTSIQSIGSKYSILSQNNVSLSFFAKNFSIKLIFYNFFSFNSGRILPDHYREDSFSTSISFISLLKVRTEGGQLTVLKFMLNHWLLKSHLPFLFSGEIAVNISPLFKQELHHQK